MAANFDVPLLRERASGIAGAMGIAAPEPGSDYFWNMASYLRTLPPEQSNGFMDQFFGRREGEDAAYFPNGTELAGYMGRLARTPWFRPKGRYGESDLKELAGGINDAFRIGGSPRLLITGDLATACGHAEQYREWSAAADAAWKAAADAAGGAGREAVRCVAVIGAWDATRHAGWGVIEGEGTYAGGDAGRHAAWGAGRCAAGGAQHITAQDLPQLREEYPENPFEKLLQVYELGICPASFTPAESVFWRPRVFNG